MTVRLYLLCPWVSTCPSSPISLICLCQCLCKAVSCLRMWLSCQRHAAPLPPTPLVSTSFRKLQKLRVPQNLHLNKILSNLCAYQSLTILLLATQGHTQVGLRFSVTLLWDFCPPWLLTRWLPAIPDSSYSSTFSKPQRTLPYAHTRTHVLAQACQFMHEWPQQLAISLYFLIFHMNTATYYMDIEQF